MRLLAYVMERLIILVVIAVAMIYIGFALGVDPLALHAALWAIDGAAFAMLLYRSAHHA